MSDSTMTKKITIDDKNNDDDSPLIINDESDVDTIDGESDVESVVSDENIVDADVDEDVDGNVGGDDDDEAVPAEDEDDMQTDEVLTVPKKEASKLPTQQNIEETSVVENPEIPQEQPVVEHLTMQDDTDSESDSEEYDDSYLQKFSDDQKKSLIEEYHPEIIYHNNSEIEQLSKCVKNSKSIVCDPLHMTIPFLTKFEYTRILGMRTKQINNGSKPFVKVPEGIIDGYLIAEKELREKKLPFIIKRPIPNGGCEYWKLQDLELRI